MRGVEQEQKEGCTAFCGAALSALLKAPKSFELGQMLCVVVIIGHLCRHSFNIAGIRVDTIDEAGVATAPVEVRKVISDGDKITALAALGKYLRGAVRDLTVGFVDDARDFCARGFLCP